MYLDMGTEVDRHVLRFSWHVFFSDMATGVHRKQEDRPALVKRTKSAMRVHASGTGCGLGRSLEYSTPTLTPVQQALQYTLNPAYNTPLRTGSQGQKRNSARV